MAYFVADEKLQGYYVSGGVKINIVKYHFECDDAASLPAQTAFILSKKVKISMASTAHTIDTDSLYEMNSAGTWIQHSQPWQPLADYSVLSNKPQINGHTLTGNQSGDDLGLQNVLTFDNTPTQYSTNPVTSAGIWTDQQRQDELQTEDRAALVELVDGGAKNIYDYNKSYNYTNVTMSDGVYTSSGDTRTSLKFKANVRSGNTNVQVIAGDAAGTIIQQNGIYHWIFTLTSGGEYILMGHNGSQNDGTYRYPISNLVVGGTYVLQINVTRCSDNSGSFQWKDVMICTEAAWRISQEYQPYRPSWQEMYDMIQALQ